VRLAGILSEDEPDPRPQWREQARQMPMPIFGLVHQRHLEDWDAIGIGSGTRGGELDSCEASISYTLWRNPDELDDPLNLAELDPQQRRALDVEPPWPRPPWLVEQVRRMRHPMLWECVRTHWRREPREPDSAPALLVAHVNDILANRFQPTRVVGDDPPANLANPVDHRSIESDVRVLVDGTARQGFRIDTDPYVYGLGVNLDAHTALTAAIPRDALTYVEVTFATRSV
jgi:hypothetical protein